MRVATTTTVVTVARSDDHWGLLMRWVHYTFMNRI
jgi:hypothetical protein